MALSEPLCEWKVPLLAEQEEQGGALLPGHGCWGVRMEPQNATGLPVHIDTEEKKTLLAGPNSGLFKNQV